MFMSDLTWTFVFVAVMLLTLVGCIIWQAIRQVLLFRKTRQWTPKFVISAVYLTMFSIGIINSVISVFR